MGRIMKPQSIEDTSNQLLFGIEKLIEQRGRNVAVYLNTEICCLYWSIGNYIITEMQYETYSQHGQQILATLSQRLTAKFGKGYTHSALTRMMKVAEVYSEEKFATVSQTLSWSHFIELIAIEDTTKRLFYQQMCMIENWSVRTLRQKEDSMLFERTAIAAKPDDVILQTLQKTGNTNLNPDLVFKNTYVLDLLFYHRKLNCLVAIDLKLGKFKPKYKGQMELYLKYLQKYEKQPHENSPIGLLLCSEGNTEHIELLLLDEENIKVAQYLTTFPDKQWFVEKLNKSIAIAQQNVSFKRLK